jgi:hypothetical protein
MQQARLSVSRLMGNDQSEKLAGKLAFSHQTLSKMLGEASGRALDACWAEAYKRVKIAGQGK